MKDKETHKSLEVALTLANPLTAVVADVTVTSPNEHDKKVTCTKIKAGIAMPPARAKEFLLQELGDEPGEVQVLRGDEPLPEMVAEGARALRKSLTNLLQAMGGKGKYEAVVADLRQIGTLDPLSELETLVLAESTLSVALGVAFLTISIRSFIIEWGRLHDHLDGGRECGISFKLVDGEPDAATAEALLYAFSLGGKTRVAQPAIDTPACVRAAAVDVKAFMFRGLIDVLHCLGNATESAALTKYMTEGADHE